MTYRLLLVVAALALVPWSVAADDQPKRTDPSLAEDVQDVIFFSEGRPVLIRLHVTLDGKPFQAYWDSYLKELFQYLDRDNDGMLSEREAERGPSPQQLTQPFTGRLPQQGGNARFKDMAADPSTGKATLEEFIAYYRKSDPDGRSGASGLQVVTGTGRGTQSDALTEALFKYLDMNQDGKLSKDELLAAASSLRKLDENDDELVSTQELMLTGFVGNQFQPQPQPQPRPGVLDTSTFLVVTRKDSPRRLTERLTVAKEVLGRYDQDKNDNLSQKEIRLPKETFDLLDDNKDGELNVVELLRWLILTPDVELAVRIGKIGEKEAPVEILRPGGKDTPLAAAVSKATHGGVMMSLGNAHLDLRRLEGRAGNTGNFRPYYVQQFKTAAGNKGFVVENDLRGNQYQFLRPLFNAADRDEDGKLTEAELNAYLDLQDKATTSYTSLTIAENGRGLFELLDANRDGQLSVRELKTAWSRLASTDRDGSGQIARNQIPRQFQLTLGQGQTSGSINPQGMFMVNPRQPAPQPAPGSTRGPTWFRKMDRNGDGDVSLREFLGTRADFERIDTNGDGVISAEEAEAADAAMRKKLQQKP